MMIPSWVDSMPIGHWFRISGDHPDLDLPTTPPGTRYLEDNEPATDLALNPALGTKERLRRFLGKHANAPWQGRCGFSSITEAWNSAVFASRFGKCGSMVVYGGGHNDYFGSDLHAFDLHTRQWSRIDDGFISLETEAFGAGAVYPYAEYENGSPLPPHTYDYVQYNPAGNDYILFKGQRELGPNVKAVAIPHMFNFDTLSWRRGPQHPTAILNSGGWTVWDDKRRMMWGHSGDAGGGNAFLSFDPNGENCDGTFGSWGEIFSNKLAGEANHNAMSVDLTGDIIVISVHSRNELFAIDPNRPEKPILQLRSSANKPRIQEFAALEYAPGLGGFVYYSATNGAALYKISRPSGAGLTDQAESIWNWETLLHKQNSLDPIADARRTSAHNVNLSHTFGRFRIASYADIDVAVLVRHVTVPFTHVA